MGQWLRPMISRRLTNNHAETIEDALMYAAQKEGMKSLHVNQKIISSKLNLLYALWLMPSKPTKKKWNAIIKTENSLLTATSVTSLAPFEPKRGILLLKIREIRCNYLLVHNATANIRAKDGEMIICPECAHEWPPKTL